MEVEIRARESWYRVPLLVTEIKEIVFELIPYSRTFEEEFQEKMDVDLIVQEMRHGALNVQSVMEFVASHLHQYCAPCRDDLVDDVVALCRFGRIPESLKKLLTVFELMKLDFANHHLRKLRRWIMENAAEYEWKIFKESVERKGGYANKTKRWLEKAKNGKNNANALNVYNEGKYAILVRHLSYPKPPSFT